MSPLDLERFFWEWWLSELRNAAEREQVNDNGGDQKNAGEEPDFQAVSILGDDRTDLPNFRNFVTDGPKTCSCEPRGDLGASRVRV
jgi:hypothetical protein